MICDGLNFSHHFLYIYIFIFLTYTKVVDKGEKYE